MSRYADEELKAAQEGKNLLASMVVDLENQLETAKAEKAEAYTDNATLANQVRRLEGVVAELTLERDNLLADATEEKSRMAKAIESLQGQLDGLIFDRDAAEKARKRSEDAWRLERQSLEEQLRKNRKFNDDLNEQLATKEIDLARSLGEKQEARHVSRSERQMRELFEGHLAEAKTHQDFLRQRMRELEAEAADATAQYHKVGDVVFSLQDRCTELEASKAALAKSAAATEAMLNDELLTLKTELNSFKANCKSLEKAVAELKDLLIAEKRLTTRKSEETASQAAEIVKLKHKLADANEDETLLCNQMEQLKETITLLSKEKSGMLQQKSGEKDTTMEELRVLRQALNMAEANTEAALTQTRTEKNQIIAEMQDFAEQLAAAKAETKSLSAQLSSAEAAVARTLADKEELDGERRFLAGECTELISQLSSTRAEKEAMMVEIAELQVLLRSQEVELQDDHGDLTRATRKTDTVVMIRDHDEIRSTFDKLRDENEMLHAQVAQLKDHVQTAELAARRLEHELGTEQHTRAHAQATAEQAQALANAASASAQQAHATAAAQAAHMQAQTAGFSQHADAMRQDAMRQAAMLVPQMVPVPVPMPGMFAAPAAPAYSAVPAIYNDDFRGLIGENERLRDRTLALEEELANQTARKEVDRSILEEQLRYAEARAEKAELVDEIEDKLREALEEIARLESELVQGRAEAAERDIQWQSEVDALAETYEQLQMELKKRERDIEEMKEGAWLSAELQYMAKKVEDAEIAERKHIQESKELIDKLEQKDAELCLLAAKADEANGTMRALEHELNDERFTNKDLIREIHNLRLDLERAETDKEKALAAAEKFVQRNVESTSQSQETLKGALKDLGSSLDTIRSDKARVLAEKEAIISEKNAEIMKLTRLLKEMTDKCDSAEKQLALSQKMLRAALASSASRFGQTLLNHRYALMQSGFKQWASWFSYARLESQVADLTRMNALLRDSAKMIALKKIFGRWKNQQFLKGWNEWLEFHRECQEEGRLAKMLANMTAAERAKALARLQNILDMWNGNMRKVMWGTWKQLMLGGRGVRAKVRYAAMKWKKKELAAGFGQWKYQTKMDPLDRLTLERDALKEKLARVANGWMRDKFFYEGRIYSDSQRNRLFQAWKYQTEVVRRTTERMKLLLGTLTRDKGRLAFSSYKDAVAKSKEAGANAYDKKLLEKAKMAAMQKLRRVFGNINNAAKGAGFRCWKEVTAVSKWEKEDAAMRKELEEAEKQGYERGRQQFEPHYLQVKDELWNLKMSKFKKHIDTFTGNVDRAGKVHTMQRWKSNTGDKAEREERKKREEELKNLREKIKKAENEIESLKSERSELKKLNQKLQNDADNFAHEWEEQMRKLKADLENSQRELVTLKQTSELEKRHAENLLAHKIQELADERDGFGVKAKGYETKIRNLSSTIEDQERSISRENDSRIAAAKYNRDKIREMEEDFNALKESELNSQRAMRSKDSESKIVQDSLTQVLASLATARTDATTLQSDNKKLKEELAKMSSNFEGVKKKLDQALVAQQSTASPQSDLDRIKASQPKSSQP